MQQRYRLPLLLLSLALAIPHVALAQDDVMMQAFYWDVPVDETNENGFWWDTLAAKAPALGAAGFTGVWTPPPSKGNWGIVDMGYGLFDHYDLGNYDQKGSIETRFGSRSELLNMVNAMHANGIEVYADIILNHVYADASEEQANPAVKQYVFDEARRDLDNNGSPEQYSPFPTNEIRWRIPSAAAGDYYIKIKGYHLDCSASYTERGYDLYFNWDGSADQPNTPANANWESEPNGGGGQSNVYPGSGEHVWAHINTCSDIDEYKVTVSASHDLDLRLEARREMTDGNGSWTFAWASQTNGYYPVEIWHNGSNLAATSLQARTNTGLSYVNHTGIGEANHTWSYGHFHPVDNADYLGYPGSDEIIPNTRFFGNDLNTFDTAVQGRLKDWGVWLTNTVGYDGYRLDFVRGFQESFAADWIKAMPLKNGIQRFVVGEYWGADYRIKNWVNALAGNGADADGFDFPLKNSLKDMANGNSGWDMRWLNHAGLVRNDQGNSLPGTSVVTFVDNHDTGKEHDKWVTKDWDMAYAYMLFAEGRPTVFYSHYYGVLQHDHHDPTITVQAPASLQSDINDMIFVRRTYLDGGMIVLSEIGNPYPSGDAANVYAARRQGGASRPGAILVLNNHETDTKGLWVDNAPASGYANWAGKDLVTATDGAANSTHVYNDGRVWVWAPPRSFTVWVPQDEFVSFMSSTPEARPELERMRLSSVPHSFSVRPNYPDPFNPSTTISFDLPEEGRVEVLVHDVLGRRVTTLVNGHLNAGTHALSWEASSTLPSGVYYYTVSWKEHRASGSMVLLQ